MAIDAFISYAHADDKALDRLHKHLAMLRRDGGLHAWSDHEILAGTKFGGAISSSLESSALFLALVSPDYMASRYCYDEEFRRALELSETGRIRIVPIILEPCDWLSSPLRDFLALPKDGKPISDWTNENNAFLDVVTGLRRLLESLRVAPAPDINSGSQASARIGRRPMIKQDFDTIQKSEFADAAFDVIQNYFKESCVELNEVGDGTIRAKFEGMSATAFTCTVVNRARRSGGEGHITVRNAKQRAHFGDISYVYQRFADDGTSNGGVRVEADEYELYLVMDSMSSMSNKGAKLNAHQVANTLW
ncbi:MAG: toll/interleukin-1 receptor domain-containing protein [Rhodospirillales bacterium]